MATYFGKRHDDVLKAIRNIIGTLPECVRNFAEAWETVEMPRGGKRKVPTFDMTRDGFSVLAMGFTGAKALRFKLAYIVEFNAMEDVPPCVPI